MLLIGLIFKYLPVEAWVRGHPGWLFLAAIAIGLVPQSGPHLLFVSLYASGLIPFPVLLANSIVQDGHSALPLLAESKAAFFKVKALKCALALLVFAVWSLL